MQWSKFGLCRLSSLDSLACKIIIYIYVSQARYTFCSAALIASDLCLTASTGRGWCCLMEWVSIVRLTWHLFLSYLSGSHLIKQSVPECDFADTDFHMVKGFQFPIPPAEFWGMKLVLTQNDEKSLGSCVHLRIMTQKMKTKWKSDLGDVKLAPPRNPLWGQIKTRWCRHWQRLYSWISCFRPMSYTLKSSWNSA